MEDPKWFEAEDPLDEVQQAFVDVLRARATSWPLDPRDTCLLLPDHEDYGSPLPAEETADGKLLVYADIPDTAQNVILLTVGAYLHGDHVRGDDLHNQLLTLPAQPSPLALCATGTPAELASHTADWFETLLRRPIVRHEWLHAGAVYAHRWSFADTEQPLLEGLRRASDLGQPDRTVHVREDLR